MSLMITLAVDAGCAVVVALLTSFWLEGQQAFIVGVAALVLIEIIRLRSRSQQVDATLAKLSGFIESLGATDAYSELRLLYSLRPAVRVSAHEVSVPKEEVLQFWRDCVARAKGQWFVATYARSDETWELGWGHHTSIAIQRERIDEGCHIRRVFVVDSEEEKESMRKVMAQHRQIGIDVRWILKSDLLSNHAASEAFKKVGTLDVAVVDGTWIYRTHLDRARRISCASASDDQELLDQAKFLTNEAWRRGHAERERIRDEISTEPSTAQSGGGAVRSVNSGITKEPPSVG